MPAIPVETRDFPQPNAWGVPNRTSDEAFSITSLLHAAISAGHGMGWCQAIRAQIGGLSELLWKQHAFRAAVYPTVVALKNRNQIERLMPTPRFSLMDPSEKRGLTYHLGNTMATAWGRAVLNIPWWLHLDVYWDEVKPVLHPGDSRPDLVGRHSDGRWVVMESKGRSSNPNQEAEGKAKAQSQRVVSIGGEVPSLHIAAFSFFAIDRGVNGRSKPSVVNMRVLDPEGSSEKEGSLALDKLTNADFFRLYYRNWDFLFANEASLNEENAILWREIPDIDLRVGILDDLKEALDERKYTMVPDVIAAATEGRGIQSRYPFWTGDGIILELGDAWTKNWCL